MDINVYSVSRQEESVREAPAATDVLTAGDIRRARATTIPEALRLVPGVQVARVDANKWAVSIRGFNSRTTNNLPVMVDGRSIYDPLFSGVLWESRDVMLEDIERIEVVRGNVQRAPPYTALDVAVGWRPRRELEVALVGQNLFDSHHPEQAQFGVVPNAIGTEAPRGAYVKLNWKF